MKPKRYIIEMCNDFTKKFYDAGMTEQAARIDALRNGYICGLIADVEVMKEILNLIERD